MVLFQSFLKFGLMAFMYEPLIHAQGYWGYVSVKLSSVFKEGHLDFVIGLVNSVPSLPVGQVKFFLGIQITEEL